MKRVIALILIISVCVMVGCNQTSDDMQITFLNTGDSDCIIIKAGDAVIMIDTAYDYSYEKIKAHLDNSRIEKIDYLILTHFDKDHIGSASHLIKNYQIGEIIAPDYVKDSVYISSLVSAIESTATKFTTILEDKHIELDNCRIWINAPKLLDYDDENNYSLIVSLKYENHSFLFMGDALKARTKEFLTVVDLEEWNYSLIKAPHHGDYSKPYKELCEASQIQYSIITNSQNNTEKKLLELNQQLEIQSLFTPNGDVIVTVKNGNLSVTQE